MPKDSEKMSIQQVFEDKKMRQDQLVSDIKSGRISGNDAFINNSCFTPEDSKKATLSFGKVKK